MAAGLARVQSQDLMQMLDRALGFTRRSFQPAENPQHDRIVGVHLVGTACIRERLGIAIQLSAMQNAQSAQRVAEAHQSRSNSIARAAAHMASRRACSRSAAI